MINKQSYLLGLILLSDPTFAENAQWVEWIASTQVSITDIDNLNTSAFSNDKVADQQLFLSANLGRFYQLSNTSRFHVALDLSTQSYQDTSAMNEVAYGINTGFRHKFGLGFDVPYVQINLNILEHNVKAKGWSRSLADVSFELGKHFSQRLSLASKFTYNVMKGKSGPVIVAGLPSNPFDQNYWQLTLFADYLLAQDWLLSANYTYRDGDMNSACTVENVAIVLANEQVDAITQDTIFGGCVYRLTTTGSRYSANLSYAWSNHAGIDFTVSTFSGNADVLSYRGNAINLTYNYRY